MGSRLMNLLGLEKAVRLWKVVQFNGGILSSIYKIYRFDALKMGKYIGKDCMGNKYFESNFYFYGRSRWVEHSPAFGLDYDGSQIPPEWHGWLHYRTNDTPLTKPPTPHRWLMSWEENKSGTSEAYYPYTTTQPKIQAWTPPKAAN